MVDNLIDNYIYLYHTDEWLLLPQYPDSIADKLTSTFASQNVLSRTAPIYAYSNSGPREVNVSLALHRDLVNSENLKASNLKINVVDGEDYVDTLIKRLQSIALPRYNATDKSIDPPMVALRFGNDIFIKGIVNGGISLEYMKPILYNNKYAQVTVNFNVYEITPFDADSVAQLGSFRGITRMFKDGIYAGNNNGTPKSEIGGGVSSRFEQVSI